MKLSLFTIFCLSVLLPLSSVFAADYTVMPLLVDHNVQPRDSISESVKVSNTTNQPLRLFPTVPADLRGAFAIPRHRGARVRGDGDRDSAVA